ncbi:MAG: UDP-N-acetylmuramate--L-alanine ligase [Patescibacteria group bacterium]|jgi:UDP-N-acetylmuramate--alanine ligase
MLLTAKHIHFIGISGIGISAIAKWALENNKQVTGSDLSIQLTSRWLIDHGANIKIGQHKAGNLRQGCDLVIYSNAIPENNIELISAKKRNIPCISYPQAINELMQNKNGIAIAGTHGKSTTTGLLAQILIEARKDPTIIVGTRLRILNGTNERIGQGKEFLVEADEYRRAFLDYKPNIAAILNIDFDHVDVYKNESEYLQVFKTFAGRLPKDGFLILNKSDKNSNELVNSTKAKVITFALLGADLTASNIISSEQGLTFDVNGLYSGHIQTSLFGQHNILNVLAALGVAKVLNIKFEIAKKAIQNFSGCWRRFEKRGEWQGAIVIDDYAHHPTELRATLGATRQAFPNRRIICVFQPHQKIRTQQFLREFVQVLKLADLKIIPEIYQVAGREENLNISSQEIVDLAGSNAYYAKNIADAVEITKKLLKPKDIILTVGAGDITNFYSFAKNKIPNG